MTEDLKHFNILNFLLLQKRNNNLCNVSYTVKTIVLAYISMGFLIYKFSDDFLKLRIFFQKIKMSFSFDQDLLYKTERKVSNI